MSDLDSSDLTLPLLMAIIAFGLVLLHLVIRIGCGQSSPDIVMFYDEANALNFRHQYIVRLLYGPKSSSYEDTLTTIFAEVEHSINRIVKIPFTPATISRNFEYKGHRCAKIFIRTAEHYSNVSKLLMYHNGRGSIVVVALELQDIDAQNSIAAVVNNPVFSATGDAHKVTSYPFGREQTTLLEDDIRPTRNVTIAEALYLLYTATNGVCLIGMLELEKYCVGNGVFCDYDKAFIFGAIAGAVGFGIFIVSVAFCRYIVKRFYYGQLGRGLSKFFRLFYLGAVVCSGVALGAYCAQRSLDDNYKKGLINERATVLKGPVIWGIICGFGVFCLVSLIGLSIPLAVYFRFIVLPEDDTSTGFLTKLPVRGGHRSSAQTRTVTDTFSRSNMNKFKSEEAYNAAKSYTENNSQYQDTSPPTRTRGEPHSRRQRFQRPRSMKEETALRPERKNFDQKTPIENRKKKGRSGYAHILATQQKKVRSISQYGSEEDAPLAKDRRKRPSPSGHIRKAGTRKDATPTDRDRPNSRRSAGRALRSQSSQGDNYYRKIVQVGKVKSVSQYGVEDKNRQTPPRKADGRR